MGGEPGEVEETISSLEGVAEVAVFGIAHPHRIELREQHASLAAPQA